MSTTETGDEGRSATEYNFRDAEALHHGYLVPGILKVLGEPKGRRLIDLGCGNGGLTNSLAKAGFDVIGVDASESGVEVARKAFPDVTFEYHDLNTPLPEHLTGEFPLVVSAEVIEHLFLPRKLFERADEALGAKGTLVLSTPFHGFWKNLALAATNKMDSHFSPGWDYGHIKFFSQATLGSLAKECGYTPAEWHLVGRFPVLAKSMILRATKN